MSERLSGAQLPGGIKPQVSTLGDIQNLSLHKSEQAALVNAVLSKRIRLHNLPTSLPISVSLWFYKRYLNCLLKDNFSYLLIITDPHLWQPQLHSVLTEVNSELRQGKFVQKTVFISLHLPRQSTQHLSISHSCFVLLSPSKL